MFALSRMLPLLLLTLGACQHVGDEQALVIMFSIDTLGQSMADRTEFCGELQALFQEYDLELACLEGAISPSSWTGEAHTRLLWPQHMIGDKRAAQYPTCGDRSVLSTIAQSTGGRYLWGADNSVLGDSGKEQCGWFRTQFTQDVDGKWETPDDPTEVAVLAEADRPVHGAIDAFVKKVDNGDRGIAIFLNALESGGHEPRCWFDPNTTACDSLWNVAVTNGLVAEGDDREATWLDLEFFGTFMQLFSVRKADEEARWRPLFWQSIDEAVRWFRGEMVLERVRRMLDAAQAAGRLGDVRFVAFGDHGENPCVARGLGDDTLNCGHSGLPTEFTAFVPVYVAPASLAEAWQADGIVGDATQPWSLVNLSFGLLDSVHVPIPDDWPAMEPVGSATSWICLGPDGAGMSGVRVEGDVAMRCRRGTCEASTFTIPEDETYVPTLVTDVPASLAAYATTPDWFTTACGG